MKVKKGWKENTNENCLEGMRCPKCGQFDSFNITVLCCAVVTDDGVDEYLEPEWDGDSGCVCGACGHSGMVQDFEEE